MAKVTIYDSEGVALERDAIDARECVASGGYAYQPPVLDTAVLDAAGASQAKKKEK